MKNLIGSPPFWRMVGTIQRTARHAREEASMSIKRLHLTKPLVTHLADARSAPNDFAAETNVMQYLDH